MTILEAVRRIIQIFTSYMFKLFNYSTFGGRNIEFRGMPYIIRAKNIECGKHLSCNENVYMHAGAGIVIGNYVTLSHGCSLISVGLDTQNWIENQIQRDHCGKKITIHDNVWIGANAVVLSGVEIARGSVVAAGAVVTRNLETENALYAGVPARLIKKLI